MQYRYSMHLHTYIYMYLHNPIHRYRYSKPVIVMVLLGIWAERAVGGASIPMGAATSGSSSPPPSLPSDYFHRSKKPGGITPD